MQRTVPLISINSKVDHAGLYDSFTYMNKQQLLCDTMAWSRKKADNFTYAAAPVNFLGR